MLKCLALTLAAALPPHRVACAVMDHLGPSHFVLRTEVKSYYASIDHARLMSALADYVRDSRITSLLYQYLTRCAERGGLFFDHTRGISLAPGLTKPVL